MTTLVIPDLHAPFAHPGALDFISDLLREYRPRKVVNLGDEIDMAALSRFTRDPDMDNAGEELRKARLYLGFLGKLVPKMAICNSNHTQRPFKRAMEAGLPAGFMRSLPDILGSPRGWYWRDTHEIDGVLFIHGEGFSGQTGHLKAATHHRRSVVIGHLHTHAGIGWLTGSQDRIFGFNVGCLLDPSSPAFSYGKWLASRPCLGAGIIEDGVPRWIPLPT